MKALKPQFSVLPWPRNFGGPDVMVRRFIENAKRRGYSVVPEWFSDKSQPCLLNIGHRSQSQMLSTGRHVAYRVAGLYIKDYFERLGAIYGDRSYKPEFESANRKIAEALSRSDFVIYQSRWAKSRLDLLCQRSEKTWRIIPNAVDLGTFSPAPNWPRTPGDRPVIGAVGSLRYRPRLEVLFDVARRLPVKPYLIIVGTMDTFCQSTLDAILKDPAWRGLVEYIPAVAPSRLVEYYRRMDCLVHTVAGDVCPNVVVEALACGVPVVCHEDGGTVELVGSAGVSVADPESTYSETFRAEVAESLTRVLCDLQSFQKMARRRAEENNNLDILTSFYLDALGFPPYPYKRGWRYTPTRIIGQTGAKVVPKIRKLPTAKPRIGLILWDWNLGGIASWMFRLTKALSEFEFHFVATHLEVHAPACDQIGTFAYAPNLWTLANYLRKERINLVQVSNNRWPIDAARLAGVPRIIERTDGTRSCCVVEKNDLDFLIISAAGTAPLIRRFWPEVPHQVVYNAIDLEEVDRASRVKTAPAGDIAIGRCTRFGRGKRLDLLIDAFGALMQKGLPVHLTLVGEDSRLQGAVPVEQELRHQARPLGDAVTFYGRADNPISLTKGWDIGVCCSDPFNEGIPNSLIEPMACGIPVVATDIDQVGELVQDGVNGLLVPPQDRHALSAALERLASDPELRRDMGQAARRTIESRFSFEVALEQYQKVYSHLTKYEHI